ncbi:uncharacterized protein LAJ45_00803 [Morchella importuna]|uniref:uncharacterized protein n=1 Tax=Morchella importuna TaxID=1174673 RepID=UPI001E8DA300|nr:uncharacterized protein LAJ45_00803 [Morchella importuna]KAH8155791.1 hypothetical protein LAJ45_00803 [Morchella importuna]
MVAGPCTVRIFDVLLQFVLSNEIGIESAVIHGHILDSRGKAKYYALSIVQTYCPLIVVDLLLPRSLSS